MQDREVFVANLKAVAKPSQINPGAPGTPAVLVDLSTHDGACNVTVVCEPADAPDLRDEFVIKFVPKDSPQPPALAVANASPPRPQHCPKPERHDPHAWKDPEFGGDWVCDGVPV